MTTLTERQLEILIFLRGNANPGDATLLNRVVEGTLMNSEIQRVCELINNEYLMNGILEDYSPNSYGKELEELMNLINEPRLY